MAELKEILETAQTKMHKTVDVLRVDLASVRAGRASVSLLDKVMVEYYGTPTPVGGKRYRAGTAHDCNSAVGKEPAEGY